MYAYVDRPVEHLCHGGRLILWAMRGWTHARSRGTCPPAALSRGFAGVGALPALPHFHVAMVLLNKDARQSLALAPMDCPVICEDEAILISLWNDVTRHDVDHMRETLSLIALDATALPISQAMAAATANFVAAGFDLSNLLREIPKELN